MYVVFILASMIVIFSFTIVCAWLGFQAFMAVLCWVLGLFSGSICEIFGLVCWIFGKRETKVVLKSPKRVKFRRARAKGHRDGEKLENIHTWGEKRGK